MNNNPEIFISYAWGDKNEKGKSRETIVNELYEDLTNIGFKVIRDKVNLSYGGKISDFMKKIGRGKYVVVIISDKYLKSEYCMYEILEIIKNKAYKDRIFPIILSDADIFDEVNRLEYLDYWSRKRETLQNRIRKLKELTDANIANEKLKLYDDIREVIGEFTGFIKDVNSLTPDMHRENDFADLIKFIKSKHKEDQLAPHKDEKEKSFQESGEEVGSKNKMMEKHPPPEKKSQGYAKYLIPLLLLPFLIYFGMSQFNTDNSGGAGIDNHNDSNLNLKIGDTHEGGIVFDVDPLGQGMVCSFRNMGKFNWNEAVAKCDSYTSGGYSDWRLPSEDELNLIYINLYKNSLGGFGKSAYWSSYKYDDKTVFGQSFIDGQTYGYPMDADYVDVLAVRNF